MAYKTSEDSSNMLLTRLSHVAFVKCCNGRVVGHMLRNIRCSKMCLSKEGQTNICSFILIIFQFFIKKQFFLYFLPKAYSFKNMQ